MLAAERIFEMLRRANSDSRKFPATIFYNEGWLLRLVLDWFSQRDEIVDHPLNFAQGARWFSEALLPSQFRARREREPLAGKGRDHLAENHTHADGVIGHIMIGSGAKADTSLANGASQFLVTEAKLFSPLSPGVRNARYFDQAARTVACIAEVLSRSPRQHPKELSFLSFLVLAPAEQIGAKIDPLLSKSSIRDKVGRRVAQYAGSPAEEKKNEWLRDWFEPTLEKIHIQSLAWEEIIDFVRGGDPEFGPELLGFYEGCCQFN